MLKISAQRGLCSACKNDFTCTYPREFSRPVLQCEEFELGVMPRPEATGKGRFPSRAREKHSGKYLGLCSNCEDRETCIYPKPEGGVWHCDEYR